MLSALAAEHQADFPDFYTATLEAGEASGQLHVALAALAHNLDRSLVIRKRLRAACIQPAILLSMAFLSLGTVVVVLIPSLLPLFEGREASLPFLMRGVLALDRAWTEHWLELSAGASTMVGALLLAFVNSAVRRSFDRFTLSLPILGRLVSTSQSAAFCTLAATMLQAGVPLPQTIRLATGVVRNRVIVEHLQTLLIQIKAGNPVASCLPTPPFPKALAPLVEGGERAGRLADTLHHAARNFDQTVEHGVEKLLSLFTPLVTLLVGLVIASLVMAVMDAILSVNDLAV